jgi:rhodanese-related sulfurtransferase
VVWECVIISQTGLQDGPGHRICNKQPAAGGWLRGGARPADLDRKLLVVCKNGPTAVVAANNLRKIGAADVAVLKGGMNQWRSDQFPVTTK